MKKSILSAVMVVGLTSTAVAQMAPWVVPYEGVATNASGQPLSGPLAMTFMLFEESAGGTPLWVEVQVVNADAQGQYVAFLGSSTGGIPTELLSGGAARWLGAQPENQPEQARVQLLSVPYALKAADAETLGGLPASAYLTAPDAGTGGLTSSSGESAPALDGDGNGGEGGGLTASAPELVGAREDQVINDDLIVASSACVGLDCVNGESFGFDTIRLKENNLRIGFQDTSVGTFPTNDWQLTANDSASGGANKFSIDDITGGRTPFTVTAGARSNSIFVDSGGRVGFGTATPVLDLHVATGNTPALRLDQNATSGFTPQVWDVAGNEQNFFVRDVTGGSTLPFRVFPGAPSNALIIEGTTGDVGLGTNAPAEPIHVKRGDATATTVKIENTSAVPQRADVQLANVRGSWFVRNNTAGSFVLNKGEGAAELELTTAGNLTILGGLTVVGNCNDGNGGGGGVDGCDYVFHPDYELPTIEDHAREMWENRYLPAVGPTPEDAPWNIGRKSAGMLNELEKAHIYIEQLHNRMVDYEHRVADFEQLTQRLKDLEAKLATLVGDAR